MVAVAVAVVCLSIMPSGGRLSGSTVRADTIPYRTTDVPSFLVAPSVLGVERPWSTRERTTDYSATAVLASGIDRHRRDNGR